VGTPIQHPELSVLITALALALATNGCSDALEAPSAYESQRFLCTPENHLALQQELELCRTANQSGPVCGGVVSFRGTLQNQPVLVESHAFRTSHAIGPDTQSFWTFALSPYFEYNIQVYILTAERTLILTQEAGSSIRLASRSGSFRSPFITAESTIHQLTDRELSIDLRATLSTGDELEACLHLFVTE
jgi:hypothetical protein